MINIDDLLKAYETDVNSPNGLGHFETLNMLTNRDVLEEHRNQLTTLQSARLLIADEKLMLNRDLVIAECGGKTEFVKLRQHKPIQSAWWWFLEQIPLEQLKHSVQTLSNDALCQYIQQHEGKLESTLRKVIREELQTIAR